MSRLDVQQNSEDGVIHEYNRQLCVGHVIGSLPINMKKQSQTVSVFFFHHLRLFSSFPVFQQEIQKNLPQFFTTFDMV